MVQAAEMRNQRKSAADAAAAAFLQPLHASYWQRRWRLISLICIATIAIAAGAFRWSQHAGVAELRAGSEQRIAALTAALFAPVDKFSYLPEVVGSYQIIGKVLGSESDPSVVMNANELLAKLNASAKSAVIYILNREGRVVASSNWQEHDSFIGKDYSFRPYFTDAINSGAGQFYGMGTTSLQPGYYQSAAIDRGSNVIGVAVVKVDLSQFGKSWHQKDEMAVTDRNGVIFLSSVEDWKYRPLRPLTQGATSEMRATRQYDNALKAPLTAQVLKDFAPGEQLMRIGISGGATQRAPDTLYFSKTATLPGTDWTAHVFTPIADIDLHATWVAALSASACAFFGLILLYADQIRTNLRDRELSRKVLESAHGTLERQHQQLQTISEALRVTSATDPLTGAFNRRYFFEAIEKLLAAQRRSDSALSIIMIDIDHFKMINDQYGHPIGDQVLQTLTTIAKDFLRETDLFARLGGEEFIIALPNATQAEAILIAQRLCVRVGSVPFSLAGQSLKVTISGGVCQHEGDVGRIAETIKRADAALYQAKANGRNQVAPAAPV